jgi:hypothetical protein
MTQFDMQQIVLDTMTEKLVDTVDLRDRITMAFGSWFTMIMQGGAPPAANGAPPPAGGPAAPPPGEGEAPPEAA